MSAWTISFLSITIKGASDAAHLGPGTIIELHHSLNLSKTIHELTQLQLPSAYDKACAISTKEIY